MTVTVTRDRCDKTTVTYTVSHEHPSLPFPTHSHHSPKETPSRPSLLTSKTNPSSSPKPHPARSQ